MSSQSFSTNLTPLKDLVAELNHFLTTAPNRLTINGTIERFTLPDGEAISCILYNDIHHMTGTDIVRSLTWRFRALGWNITQSRKFEEGVFSDLRNLKPGVGATLEEPRSEFLKFLYENKCLRTQKKQKVFYWNAVDHDLLFMDALDRHLKRLGTDLEPGFNLAPGETKEDLINRASTLSVKTLLKARTTTESMGMISPISSSGSLNQPLSECARRSSLALSSPSQQSERASLHSSPEQYPMMMTPDSGDFSLYKSLAHVPPPNGETVPGSYLFHPYPSTTPRRRSTPVKPNQDQESPVSKMVKRSDMRRHSRAHTYEQTYMCPMQGCSRTFARQENLENHIRIHEQQHFKNAAFATFPKSLDLQSSMPHLIPSSQDNLHPRPTHTRSLSSPTVFSFDNMNSDSSSFLHHPELGLFKPQEDTPSPLIAENGLGSHLFADINGWPSVFGDGNLPDIHKSRSDSSVDMFLYI